MKTRKKSIVLNMMNRARKTKKKTKNKERGGRKKNITQVHQIEKQNTIQLTSFTILHKSVGEPYSEKYSFYEGNR